MKFDPDLGLARRKWFEITRQNPYEHFIEVEGSHSMNPGVPTGAGEIEKAFGIALPPDIHDFYKRWGGGFLMLCEFYYILSPEEVVRVSKRYREDREETDLPWVLFRLCDIGNGDYLGMRKSGSNWQVIFMSNEYSDTMILDKTFVNPSVLGESFYSWLKHTIEMDGVFDDKELGSPWYPEGPPAYERLI